MVNYKILYQDGYAINCKLEAKTLGYITHRDFYLLYLNQSELNPEGIRAAVAHTRDLLQSDEYVNTWMTTVNYNEDRLDYDRSPLFKMAELLNDAGVTDKFAASDRKLSETADDDSRETGFFRRTNFRDKANAVLDYIEQNPEVILERIKPQIAGHEEVRNSSYSRNTRAVHDLVRGTLDIMGMAYDKVFGKPHSERGLGVKIIAAAGIVSFGIHGNFFAAAACAAVAFSSQLRYVCNEVIDGIANLPDIRYEYAPNFSPKLIPEVEASVAAAVEKLPVTTKRFLEGFPLQIKLGYNYSYFGRLHSLTGTSGNILGEISVSTDRQLDNSIFIRAPFDKSLNSVRDEKGEGVIREEINHLKHRHVLAGFKAQWNNTDAYYRVGGFLDELGKALERDLEFSEAQDFMEKYEEKPGWTARYSRQSYGSEILVECEHIMHYLQTKEGLSEDQAFSKINAAMPQTATLFKRYLELEQKYFADRDAILAPVSAVTEPEIASTTPEKAAAAPIADKTKPPRPTRDNIIPRNPDGNNHSNHYLNTRSTPRAR